MKSATKTLPRLTKEQPRQEKPSDSFYFLLEMQACSKPRARSNGDQRYYEENYETFIRDSLIELRKQWRNLEPIESTVVLDVYIQGWHRRNDLDNLFGAIQDALVRAKVLENDNLMHIDDLHAAWCSSPNKDCQLIEIWIMVD